MGNTNIPQFGAIGTRKSRDTLVGDDQLTEGQKRERDKKISRTGPRIPLDEAIARPLAAMRTLVIRLRMRPDAGSAAAML
jgi:hypothetical protein